MSTFGKDLKMQKEEMKNGKRELNKQLSEFASKGSI